MLISPFLQSHFISPAEARSIVKDNVEAKYKHDINELPRVIGEAIQEAARERLHRVTVKMMGRDEKAVRRAREALISIGYLVSERYQNSHELIISWEVTA